jgi:hypothetical protein
LLKIQNKTSKVPTLDIISNAKKGQEINFIVFAVRKPPYFCVAKILPKAALVVGEE